MSHEFRTPLNSILGFSSLVEMEFGNLRHESTEDYFEPIYTGDGVRLYRKYQCRYLEATYNSTLSAGSKDARFTHDEALYIKKADEPAQIYNGTKSKLLKILGDNKSEMSSYLKEENLTLKNQGDLLKAINYYESL